MQTKKTTPNGGYQNVVLFYMAMTQGDHVHLWLEIACGFEEELKHNIANITIQAPVDIR